MSKEYEEMIKAVAEELTWEHEGGIDYWAEEVRRFISTIETSTCRLAVVRKKPDIGYERYWTNSAQEVKE